MAHLTPQPYHQYTPDDHQVWQALFERQALVLPGLASNAFFEALEKIGFPHNRVPAFDDLQQKLASSTGWRFTAVEGIVDDLQFFELLAQRIFPATHWIRSKEQLDYLEEPDMFHDVYGHIPLLTDAAYSAFLEGLGELGLRFGHNPKLLPFLTRLYWFTVEFGLIQEREGLRIYGAGILSSVTESTYCIGEVPTRHAFDVQRIMATSFRKDTFQSEYYVIQNFAQLYESLPHVAQLLTRLEELQQELERTNAPADEPELTAALPSLA